MGYPASRFYPGDAFHVVAACPFSATGSWTFRFGRADYLARHPLFPDRLAAVQRVTSDWPDRLAAL